MRIARSALRPNLVEVALNAPDKSRFAGLGIAVSPDGRHIAFMPASRIGSSLWIRSMNAFEPQEIRYDGRAQPILESGQQHDRLLSGTV